MQETNDHGAELIGQAIPELAETEVSPTSPGPHTCHGNEHMPPGPCLACEEERPIDAWSQEWEPSGKCQYETCDGVRFDWDSTDSRYGSWFCVKCGGMQVPPTPETPQQEIERVRESAGRVVGELRNRIDVLRTALTDALDLLEFDGYSVPNLREALVQLDGLAGAPSGDARGSSPEAPALSALIEKWRHPCASLTRYECADDLELAIKVGSHGNPSVSEASGSTQSEAPK